MVLYSLLQYRALGLVTVASLLVASVITYGVVTLLGWSHGFRLTLAGVTGLIVVDRHHRRLVHRVLRTSPGRGPRRPPLRAAVETGWKRARRTILVADSVNFLAAVVLYVLAAGGVRGFAFTLGLTTLIDVVVVFLFTHPLVALLARTKFFGEGHKWSGFDPERLGTTLPTVRRPWPRSRSPRSRAAATRRGHA